MRVLNMEEMYQADHYAITTVGIQDETLMESAGQAIVTKLITSIQYNERIVVLSGAGNNGGDAFVIARRLKNLGYDVQLWIIPPVEKIKGAACTQLSIYKKNGYNHSGYNNQIYSYIKEADVIIDCLLGIGMSGTLRPPYDQIVQAVNDSSAKVYSVDIPSGVSADGADVVCAVQADTTFTIQHPKLSAYLYPSAPYYGDLEVVDVGIPPQATDHLSNKRTLWTEQEFRQTFSTRKPDAHKGKSGRGLIVGGCSSMIGAPILSAVACIKSGIGLLVMAVPKSVTTVCATRVLEATYLSCEECNGDLCKVDIPDNIDVVSIGMGLGRSKHAKQVVRTVLEQNIPTVIDADALFYLNEMFDEIHSRTAVTILTPHMGEMAHLCNTNIETVRVERFVLSKQFAVEHGVYLVLKGPNTILTTPTGDQYINTSGNEGLAKGGSGDTLTGIITGFLPNHPCPEHAVANAIYAHGKAADLLIEKGHTVQDITATELSTVFSSVFNNLA